MKVAVDFVTLPKEGEKANGDAAMVRRADDDVLIAVIDALGHGEKAAEVSVAALAYLDRAPIAKGLRSMVEGLHDSLRGSRGAAAMLLLVHHHRLEGCGVGNVGLRSYRARVPAMLTPGVLGGSMNRLRLFQAEVAPGDRIILYSDGISTRFDEEGARSGTPLSVCQAIIERHRKPHDDATVLVADFESESEGGSARTPPLRVP